MPKVKNNLRKNVELIKNFAITDLKIKYRNSVLGFLWTFLEPLLLLSVLYIVFTNIFKNEIEHFALFLLLGLILYNTLQKGTDFGLNSIRSKTGLLTQIYLPKEIPAISATVTSSIMLIFELIVFGIFMAVFQFIPPVTILLLPLILLLEFVLIVGLSLALSVLNVRFNDIQFIWKVVIQAGFFLTPIFYTIDILPQFLQDILKFSPMVQILNMARDVTLYNTIPSLESIVLGVGTTLVVFAVGCGIFRKLQPKIVEML